MVTTKISQSHFKCAKLFIHKILFVLGQQTESILADGDSNSQFFNYKPSALAIDLNSSKAIACWEEVLGRS